MSDHDHGAYAPAADRLSFDPRVPVRSGPAPVTLIASALILVGLVGGVAFLYRHGFRHPGAAPAEIGAPVGEIRTPAAAAPAATEIPATPVEVANATPTFAPPPETPAARSAVTPPVVTPPVASAPAASTVPVQAPPAVPVQATPAPEAVSSIAPAPAAVPKSPRALAPPAQKPVTIASLIDREAAEERAASAAHPKPAAGTPEMHEAGSGRPASGGAAVQIGAFSSSALAEQELSEAAPSRGHKVEPVASGDKTLYRGLITGFASRDAAQAFCARLKDAGKSCFVR